MSASIVRVNSEKQTLILAGEFVPPETRPAARLERVSMLFVHGEYAASPRTAVLGESPTARGPLLAGPISTPPMTAGASVYARTQMLSGGRTKLQIIDIYA